MTAYAVEKMDTVLAELKALLAEQYPETGDPTVPLEPNWELYRQLEASGNAVLVIARNDTGAIGFSIVVVYKNPNSENTKIGSIPTWFIKPVQNRAMLERALLRYGIAWARERLAANVIIETEYSHTAGRLLEGMGFTPCAIKYRMALR